MLAVGRCQAIYNSCSVAMYVLYEYAARVADLPLSMILS